MSDNSKTRTRGRCAGTLAVTFAFLGAASADAAVTISSGQTSNMTCSNGVCSPNARDAVLNVGDLESLLARGNLEVTTTGNGVQADDIEVSAAVSWASTNSLTFDAYDSIAIDSPVSLTGRSGLTLTTNDGGTGGVLSFGGKGHVKIGNISSQLEIDGVPYVLVGTIARLAQAVTANPAGAYALASNYDASQDGTYSSSPVGTTLTGVFEGLGNKIENLSIKDDHQESIGFFLENKGVIRDIGLINESVTSLTTDTETTMGGLVAINYGSVVQSHTTGTFTTDVQNGGPSDGGLVGGNGGTISQSNSTAAVIGSFNGSVGGLAATNSGSIVQSFATGQVSGLGIGGLVGFNLGGAIDESYATGTVSAEIDGYAGGLVGYNDIGSTIGESYSTGAPTGSTTGRKGGLIGYDNSVAGSNSDCYWDTTTSHIPVGQGAGYPPNDPGIAGLTSKRLRSGLPDGFDPAVWVETRGINSGFPYLLANPPPG